MKSEQYLTNAVTRAKERGVLIPTFRQMCDPEAHTPKEVKAKLQNVGLWDVDPANLFRITWKNAPQQHGGLYGGVNFLELPRQLTGVRARIIALVGKWFPTGTHKVGASFGCLVPRLVSGGFDPTQHKAVWPSTGNFCRGGAYNAQLLGCGSVAILPEGMSKERFDWLKTVAGEVVATPGSESNVKEIYDKVAEIQATRPDTIVFNQFAEMGNHLWHYTVTGRAMEEAFHTIKGADDRLAGATVTSGSAGTTGFGDYLRERFPTFRFGVGEALQCPTMLLNGFGSHRIEGIGDKHIPWVHNVKNTDLVLGIDDTACLRLIRLCNTPEGQQYLLEQGIDEKTLKDLPLMGISGAANVIMAIKMAKYYEMTEHDIIMTILTDSMEMYTSRLEEMQETLGAYTHAQAAVDHNRYILGTGIDWVQELSYYDKKRIHNLKYYTWVEQQGKTVEELDAQWYDPNYWDNVHRSVDTIDQQIEEFNRKVLA